ncbi:MAG: HAD family phosphatase [bacterium]|nr:HAD family phosphatase [bacterium]
MKKSNYGFIFDLDGVIVDTEPIYFEAMNTMAKKRGQRFTMELKREVMGRGGILSMRLMKETLHFSETPEELLKERTKLCKKLLEKYGVKPVTGIFNVLRLVNKLGLKKAVASSSHRKWVESALTGLNIINEFDAIASGDEVSCGKPEPDVFLLALKRLKLKKCECIILEDTIVGLEAAKRAGIKCIAAPNKYNKGIDFSSADVIVKSLKDINEQMIKNLLKLDN